jgi:hypothetical protein
MNQISPITATAIFGGVAAVLAAGAIGLPLQVVSWPARLNAALFMCLAAYAAVLARLSATPGRRLAAPLLLLAAVLVGAASVTGFVMPAAAGLAWIRSGICFPGPVLRRVAVELLTAAGGLALCALLRPPGVAGWALGVWLFFLVQALYFAVVHPVRVQPGERWGQDTAPALHTRAHALLHERQLERAFAALQDGFRRGSDA